MGAPVPGVRKTGDAALGDGFPPQRVQFRVMCFKENPGSSKSRVGVLVARAPHAISSSLWCRECPACCSEPQALCVALASPCALSASCPLHVRMHPAAPREVSPCLARAPRTRRSSGEAAPGLPGDLCRCPRRLLLWTSTGGGAQKRVPTPARLPSPPGLGGAALLGPHVKPAEPDAAWARRRPSGRSEIPRERKVGNQCRGGLCFLNSHFASYCIFCESRSLLIRTHISSLWALSNTIDTRYIFTNLKLMTSLMKWLGNKIYLSFVDITLIVQISNKWAELKLYSLVCLVPLYRLRFSRTCHLTLVRSCSQ